MGLELFAVASPHDNLREQLHELVDQLPDGALDHARIALDYCNDPEKHHVTIERAKRRAKENSERHLRELAKRTGHVSVRGESGFTFPDGSYHSSMGAFDDGKEATYHLYVYRGHIFEIVETLEISPDGERLIRRERITGVDGKERILMVELPTRATR